MTREEKAKEAYKDYMNNGGMFQSNPWFYFKAGTEWADEHSNLESLWHNPSEEPQDDLELIIYKYKDNFWFTRKQNIIKYHYSWKNFIADEQMILWAYVKDLFPKGGKK